VSATGRLRAMAAACRSAGRYGPYSASTPATRALAARVAGLRAARGWTRRELGYQLNALGWTSPPQAVVFLEAGERLVSLDDLLLLAQVFGVSVGHLVGDAHLACGAEVQS
jgi:transcriptional regulator with XRE-family HTH domain